MIQYDEFLSLTSEQLVSLVKSDHLTVASEEKVYESVIGWIQFDVHERRKYLPQLLEHVRLPLVSQDYLMSRVENEPLMKDLNAKDFIIEALKFHLLKGDAKNTLTKTNRTIPRQPIGQPKVLLVIGGQAPKAIRSVECYDLREEQWYAAAEMPSRRCRYIHFHHFCRPIYFLSLHPFEFLQYDFVVSFTSRRAGLAVLNGLIFAVGGFNGSLRVRTVDVYDPSQDTWSTSCSMEARRSTLGTTHTNSNNNKTQAKHQVNVIYTHQSFILIESFIQLALPFQRSDFIHKY